MKEDLKIVIIGSGNVAHHLTPALHLASCNILQVYSRSIYKARLLADKVNADAIDRLDQINNTADIYLFMIKDDAIQEVAKSFIKIRDNQIVAHTSGANSIDLLKSIGHSYGSFYPLQTFVKDQLLDMSTCPFLICGSNDYCERTLRMVARQISSKVILADDQSRLKYHLSAVFMNNFSNHMMTIAEQFLEDNELDMTILDPIKSTTLEKFKIDSAFKNQTGPAKRGDKKLMQKHLKLINHDRALVELYKSISEHIFKTHNPSHENN